ncbi:TatD family hydrolase [Chitinispirillales bacterium ANBcel5]|uniref:TatD family hydrolase n=1 Tax=Cellulosispirillum alkaliphilum TaxID=3039283 RepID=UPI002A58CC0B|nr:TatD family hydrolase [Chitinispirillales bacterium ANBcel5]
MKLFDSHCHLQDERILGECADVVNRAISSGIAGIMCCGTQIEDWLRVEKLTKKHSVIYGSYGIHPWYAQQASEQGYEKLEDLLSADSRAGLGEIGLDYTVTTDRYKQLEVLSRQITIAEKYERTISVHCVKAWGDLISLFRKKGGVKTRGIIHSFSGSAEVASELVELGFFISFSGSICNLRNKKTPNSLKAVKWDRILLETDSPDLLPVGVLNGPNEPANLVFIAQRVASILEAEVDEVASSTYQNALKAFNIIDFMK